MQRLHDTGVLGYLAMDTYPLVVLANEPDTYRSLLAAELPFLRPNVRVLELDPAELAAAVLAYRPAVVISSRPLGMAPAPPCAVLILCAEEIDSYIQSCDETIDNPAFRISCTPLTAPCCQRRHPLRTPPTATRRTPRTTRHHLRDRRSDRQGA